MLITLLGGIRATVFAGIALLALMLAGVQTWRLDSAQDAIADMSLQVAKELSEHAALDAHAHVFLNLDADEQVSPWAAARASLIAFIAGSVIPLVVIITTPLGIRLPLTVAAVLAALVVTGVVSARLGGARPLPAVIRNAAVGSLAMGLTYLVGWLVGQQL